MVRSRPPGGFSEGTPCQVRASRMHGPALPRVRYTPALPLVMRAAACRPHAPGHPLVTPQRKHRAGRTHAGKIFQFANFAPAPT
jgi:hypothetical protein